MKRIMNFIGKILGVTGFTITHIIVPICVSIMILILILK